VHEVRRTIDIDAPPGAVWALLEDVRRLPELSPSTVAVEHAPERLTAPGQSFEQTVTLAGRRFTSTWEVTAIAPGRCLAIAGRLLPGTRYEMTERLEPLADGRTRLVLEMAYALPFGLLGRLANKLGAEARALDEAAQVLEGIRRVAEASTAGVR
jgi:uncharacterized membrane protein